MKKVMASLAATFVLVGGAYAEGETPNDGSGFYIGAGFGISGYYATFFDNSYNMDDPDNTYVVSASKLNDNDAGYLLYAGYQINKIIGVEFSYTDYGRFEYKKYHQEPKAVAVYANAGYTFLNGQLRPFGNLGLGYLKQNQSDRYYDLKDKFATVHFGIGGEYYPTVLKGLGFRAAMEGDVYVDRVTAVDEDTNKRSTESLWQEYYLFYAGVQYKF
ncbi:outer membrane beta-barrel protein [Sulfurimonas sp. HSL3-7]|uniref:outer membrane beta-barrel protein n=1 Tax=Sulfonitrofixus jiaomeiensis TaxID=3131938 RepID=UPI0031F9D9F8